MVVSSAIALQYDIHEVNAALAEQQESMGSKETFWFRFPGDDERPS
jgi:hypothetical protein